MILIYLKLGVGITSYRAERLDFYLSDPDHPVGVLDYSNLNETIINDINIARIVQITEAEYNGILSGLDPLPPIQIDPGTLPTINKYINGCPPAGSDFFLLYAGELYKVLYSDLKACIQGSALRIIFRVGDGTNPVNYPEDTDPSFTDARLIAADITRMMVTVNGIEIYHKLKYDPADWATTDYWELDTEFGIFSRVNMTFLEKDIVAITEL